MTEVVSGTPRPLGRIEGQLEKAVKGELDCEVWKCRSVKVKFYFFFSEAYTRSKLQLQRTSGPGCSKHC